jgi:hypothetical protein
MESILWALDLVAVLMLCRWAVAQDANASKPNGKRPG